jgi:hypothetical protein
VENEEEEETGVEKTLWQKLCERIFCENQFGKFFMPMICLNLRRGNGKYCNFGFRMPWNNNISMAKGIVERVVIVN